MAPPMSDNLKRAALGLVAGTAIGASVGVATVSFVKTWEGRSNLPYLDVGAISTVCDGHTGSDIQQRFYSDAECDLILAGDLLTHTTLMLRYVKVPLTPGMHTGFSSLIFNIGPTAFANSTLLRLLNAGDYAGACKQLLLWVKVRGRVIKGLERRRKAEYELCIQSDTRVG